MGVVVMPVYVPFLTARGLTPGDVLSLQAVYGVAVMLFEVPTGAICDLAGRRRTILIGAALNLLGLVAFAMAQGFAAYAAVELLLAAGWSLVSGADIALIYDTLDLTDAPRDTRRRVLANYILAQVLGEAAASLLGGALAGWSLTAVGWVTAAEAALPLLIALSLPGRQAGPVSHVRLMEVPPALRAVFGDRTRRLVFANMIVWSLSTFVAVWLLQPYWQEQGVGLRWFGTLWAGTLVTVGIVSRAAPLITRRIGQRGALLVLSLTPILAYGGMAALGGAGGIGCGFLFYISRGLNGGDPAGGVQPWRPGPAAGDVQLPGQRRVPIELCGVRAAGGPSDGPGGAQRRPRRAGRRLPGRVRAARGAAMAPPAARLSRQGQHAATAARPMPASTALRSSSVACAPT